MYSVDLTVILARFTGLLDLLDLNMPVYDPEEEVPSKELGYFPAYFFPALP